jgi:glycerate-2-kinase
VENIGPGELVYPNARVTQNISKSGKTTLLMQSSDKVEDVVRWYSSSLQLEKKIVAPNAESVILQGGGTTVVISSTGTSGTNIVLTNKEAK